MTANINIDLTESSINVKTLSNNKPIIWVYWETLPNRTKPDYIDLCRDTLYRHCANDFNIVELNGVNIYDYLPNLRKDINTLGLAQKTDYIRLALLFYYGGIWIDADTIVMKSLMDIVKKLNEGYDYVGFGCSGEICTNGTPRPSNWLMAAPKGSTLMKCTLADVDNVIDNYFKSGTKNQFGYFDLGKKALWNNIDKLSNKNYIYYHFSAEYDGSRDKQGRWVNVNNHVSKNKTILLNEDKMIVAALENNKFSGDDPKYNWFSKLNKAEILEGEYWISYLFKKSLTK